MTTKLLVKLDSRNPDIWSIGFHGEPHRHSAVIDQQGKHRYALLYSQDSGLLAWDCNSEHDAIECELVDTLSPCATYETWEEAVEAGKQMETERQRFEAIRVECERPVPYGC